MSNQLYQYFSEMNEMNNEHENSRLTNEQESKQLANRPQYPFQEFNNNKQEEDGAYGGSNSDFQYKSSAANDNFLNYVNDPKDSFKAPPASAAGLTWTPFKGLFGNVNNDNKTMQVCSRRLQGSEMGDPQKQSVPSFTFPAVRNALVFPLYELKGITTKPLLTISAVEEHARQSFNNIKSSELKEKRKPRSIVTVTRPSATQLESLVIDPKVIKTSTQVYTQYPILRIFCLIRRIHHFLNDVIPTRFNNPVNDEFEDSCNPKNALIESTNLQVHLKQLVHKCRIFTLSLENKINADKLLDRKLYQECEISIKQLTRSIEELDKLKTFTFEYNTMIFLGEDSKNRGRHLELLLEEIASRVRENNIFVTVFHWSVGKKRRELALTDLTGCNQLNVVSPPPSSKSVDSISSNLMSVSTAIENEKYDAEYRRMDELNNYFKEQEIENNLDNDKDKDKEYKYSHKYYGDVFDGEN